MQVISNMQIRRTSQSFLVLLNKYDMHIRFQLHRLKPNML